MVRIDYVSRNIAVAILSSMLLTLSFTALYLFRRKGKLSPILAINVYYLFLIASSIVGLLIDDGYGWGFLPVIVATMPSYLLVPVLTQGAIGRWLANGYFGSFVLVFVICGGMNSLAFYLITRLVGHAPHLPDKVVP